MGRRLADRDMRETAGGGHKIRKDMVIVLRDARVRLLLPGPDPTPLDLLLSLLPGRRFWLGAWVWAQRGGGSPRRRVSATALGREPVDAGAG
jgi:hypothetical protein